MVKLAQKRGMAGSKGRWKEFLKLYDTKFGTSLSDPSRRSVDSLAAFLKTFEQDDDLKVNLGSGYVYISSRQKNKYIIDSLKL